MKYALLLLLFISSYAYSENMAQLEFNNLRKENNREKIFLGLKKIEVKTIAFSKYIVSQKKYDPILYGYLTDLEEAFVLLPKTIKELKSCAVMDEAYNAHFGLALGDEKPQALVDFWKVFKKICRK